MEEGENHWKARGRVDEDLNWSGGWNAEDSDGCGGPSHERGSVGVGVGVSVRGLLTGNRAGRVNNVEWKRDIADGDDSALR